MTRLAEATDGNANLFALFAAAAAARAARPCLVEPGKARLTYRDMLAETAKASAWLRSLGVGAGDRVLVQVEKSAPAVLLYLACLRVGAIFVPLNIAYQPGELAYFIEDAEPALIVASPGAAAAAADFAGARTILEDSLAAAPWRDAAPENAIAGRAAGDPAAILYTSGTTGRSKGAILTHGNLSSNARTLVDAWRWRDDDILIHALPIFHVHGLFVALHCALLRATTILFHSRFDPERVIADLRRASVFMGVPTLYTRLLGDPRLDVSLCRDMRLFVSGSAPLLESTFEAFRERAGHTILERYGMTEALMVTSNPYEGPRIAGSVGAALPGVSVRVMREDGAQAAPGETGILHIKGPNLFAGYWRNPEKTAEEHDGEGYFISGDLATQDAAGVVRIVGRAKDLIISGGYNVYPKEVEDVVDGLPGVAESAVVGIPHADFGEAVLALVVAAPGSALDEAEIAAALAEQLAGFKRPKRILLVDDLPRNAMGKVQKAELRRRHADLFGAP